MFQWLKDKFKKKIKPHRYPKTHDLRGNPWIIEALNVLRTKGTIDIPIEDLKDVDKGDCVILNKERYVELFKVLGVKIYKYLPFYGLKVKYVRHVTCPMCKKIFEDDGITMCPKCCVWLQL